MIISWQLYEWQTNLFCQLSQKQFLHKASLVCGLGQTRTVLKSMTQILNKETEQFVQSALLAS